MSTNTDKYLPSGFLGWVACVLGALNAALGLNELWTRGYLKGAFRVGHGFLYAVLVGTAGNPRGWLRAAYFSLITLLAVLPLMQILAWAGLLSRIPSRL